MDGGEEAKYHKKLQVKAEVIVGAAARLWGMLCFRSRSLPWVGFVTRIV